MRVLSILSFAFIFASGGLLAAGCTDDASASCVTTVAAGGESPVAECQIPLCVPELVTESGDVVSRSDTADDFKLHLGRCAVAPCDLGITGDPCGTFELTFSGGAPPADGDWGPRLTRVSANFPLLPMTDHSCGLLYYSASGAGVPPAHITIDGNHFSGTLMLTNGGDELLQRVNESDDPRCTWDYGDYSEPGSCLCHYPSGIYPVTFDIDVP